MKRPDSKRVRRGVRRVLRKVRSKALGPGRRGRRGFTVRIVGELPPFPKEAVRNLMIQLSHLWAKEIVAAVRDTEARGHDHE